jgi:hypothetical protein
LPNNILFVNDANVKVSALTVPVKSVFPNVANWFCVLVSKVETLVSNNVLFVNIEKYIL